MMELAILYGGPKDGLQCNHDDVNEDDIVIPVDDGKFAWYTRTDKIGTATNSIGEVMLARKYIFSNMTSEEDLKLIT